MTKEIPNESTFSDCAFAGCREDKFSNFCRVLKVSNFGITRATSSLTAGIDTIGTNTAHSMRLSCPRISVLSVADSISVICAVYRGK